MQSAALPHHGQLPIAVGKTTRTTKPAATKISVFFDLFDIFPFCAQWRLHVGCGKFVYGFLLTRSACPMMGRYGRALIRFPQHAD